MAKFDPEEYEKRIKREIAEEEARERAANDARVDDDMMGEFFYLSGMNPSDIAEFGKNVPDLVDTAEAMRIIKRGQKEYKKGNRKKADKIIKSNKDAVKIANAAKKGKGCAVITILLLVLGTTTIGGLVYGAVEAVALIK